MDGPQGHLVMSDLVLLCGEPGAYVGPEGVRLEPDVDHVVNGATLTAYYVEGQGHGWPGGKDFLPARLLGPSSDKVNACTAGIPTWSNISTYMPSRTPKPEKETGTAASELMIGR